VEQKPEQIHQSFSEAFNGHDLDALVALYEPDAVLLTGAGPVKGTTAIWEVYRSYLALNPTIELETLGAFQADEIALLFGKWVLHGTGPDGPIRNEGYNTETVRRQPDGRWLFLIDQPMSPR
jgi:uncharacterized protein (TIGR02246 family)